MLSKNRLGAAPKINFRPELTNCPHCGVKLKRSHTAWNKKITTLTGVIHAWSMAYMCPNASCVHTGVAYKSAEAEMLSMKYSSYGYDVLGLVGELRFKQHRTCKEIAELLNERGIVASERYAQTLYERYQTLLAASLDEHVRQSLAETTAQNGGIILSMDGVQPEKGNEMLYVIREVFSGTVLAAQNMKSGAAGELRSLIEPIIELGFPVVGIVSDGQVSIRQAFETLLPDVPYQYCQYHYLKDIAKPVVDADRKLKMELKKSMRGLREVERKIEQVEKNAVEAAQANEGVATDTSCVRAETIASEAQVAKGYVAAVRALLLEDGEPPLKLPGMLIYERAQAIQASLARCLTKKRASSPPRSGQNFQQT
ncbi:transposase [Cohnella algarum]|uniref:transposase n=2 Tax=Paenibacillaceae TaxID=186822 RepID=UPI001968639C|nr:transposase [Cohnella algarum]MBN2980200.1 transposase [Cohnella algarum]